MNRGLGFLNQTQSGSQRLRYPCPPDRGRYFVITIYEVLTQTMLDNGNAASGNEVESDYLYEQTIKVEGARKTIRDTKKLGNFGVFRHQVSTMGLGADKRKKTFSLHEYMCICY